VFINVMACSQSAFKLPNWVHDGAKLSCAIFAGLSMFVSIAFEAVNRMIIAACVKSGGPKRRGRETMFKRPPMSPSESQEGVYSFFVGNGAD
jgi:hypothetical protein